MAIGLTDPDKIADKFLADGVSLAIVKLGAEGVMLATADERKRIAPLKIKLVCGLGSGDAFGGALSHGLINNWSIREIGEFANAAGAAGGWDPDTTPYMVEPLDTTGSRHYEAVVFVGPARTGKTASLLLGWMSHAVVNDPGDMLFLQMNYSNTLEY